MMTIHWIVDILSVMYLISTHEYGGTVIMIIFPKYVVFQMGFILEIVTNKKIQRRRLF